MHIIYEDKIGRESSWVEGNHKMFDDFFYNIWQTVGVTLTHISQASFLWEIGKQKGPRKWRPIWGYSVC